MFHLTFYYLISPAFLLLKTGNSWIHSRCNWREVLRSELHIDINMPLLSKTSLICNNNEVPTVIAYKFVRPIVSFDFLIFLISVIFYLLLFQIITELFFFLDSHYNSFLRLLCLIITTLGLLRRGYVG